MELRQVVFEDSHFFALEDPITYFLNIYIQCSSFESGAVPVFCKAFCYGFVEL